VTDNSGNVSRVADTIKGDTLTQTTAIPDPGACEQITYTANAIGAWNSNSTWLLHVASVDTDGALLNDYIVDGTNQASSGTFSSPGAVGIFWFPYFNQFDDGIYGNVTNFIFATGGSNQEHVKMTLTDGSDGSIYGFNYYLKFHQSWENLVPDPSNPDQTESETYEDNKVFTNAATNTANDVLTWGFSSQVSHANQWSFSGGLTWDIVESLKLNAGITYTTSTTWSFTASYTDQTTITPGQCARAVVTV
jgi:hypothetical protein